MECELNLASALLILALALLGVENVRAEDTPRWTSIRVVIAENREPGRMLGCAEQHIREHVYSRMVHSALDQGGPWPFVVNAQSSIDRIVISVDLLAKASQQKAITSLIEQGLRSKPSLDLLLSETRLVALEEEIISARPPMAETILWQLAATVAPEALGGCRVRLPLNVSNNLADWEISGYQLFFLDSAQLPSITPTKNRIQDKKNQSEGIYDFADTRTETHGEMDPALADGLFIGLAGSQNAKDHIFAMSQIYLAAHKVGIAPNTVRPFGIGAYVVFDNSEKLVKLREQLKAQGNDSQVNIMLQASDWARSYVCSVPRRQYLKMAEWADAVALHPYFLFWIEAPICNSTTVDLKTFTNFKPGLFYTQLISTKIFRKNIDEEQILKYSFCYFSKEKNESKRKENRELLFKAIRQYFRMDLGLSVDIKEKYIYGKCSTIGFLSPKKNHGKLMMEIFKFNYTSEKFLKRLYGFYIEDLYKKGNNINIDNINYFDNFLLNDKDEFFTLNKI